MKNKCLKYRDFDIYYKNEFEINFLIEEIFENESYFFETKNDTPFIIDCGAHIGISVLYFKYKYPNAHILAFEPDKNSFDLLQKNVKHNKLTNVQLENKAISDFSGDAIMYGDFSRNAESLGNTLKKDWGARKGFSQKQIEVTHLQPFIGSNQIDYLKLDIEGCELEVLNHIETKIAQIKQLCIEFHEYDGNIKVMDKIKKILQKNHFTIAIKNIEIEHVLYNKYPKWVTKHQPFVHIIKGENYEFNNNTDWTTKHRRMFCCKQRCLE